MSTSGVMWRVMVAERKRAIKQDQIRTEHLPPSEVEVQETGSKSGEPAPIALSQDVQPRVAVGAGRVCPQALAQRIVDRTRARVSRTTAPSPRPDTRCARSDSAPPRHTPPLRA